MLKAKAKTKDITRSVLQKKGLQKFFSGDLQKNKSSKQFLGELQRKGVQNIFSGNLQSFTNSKNSAVLESRTG